MFLKPFRVKTKTIIKGSDRKKLRAAIGKLYDVDDSLLTTVVPNKQEMTVLKLATHSDYVVTVYNVEGDPAFFEYDRVMYPTVYTLWRCPELLPVFTTWPPVLQKMQGGADLMLPGVIVKGDVTPDFMGRKPKGTPCCIKLLGNKSPVAVGKMALSTEDMYGCAMKGKGINVIHSFGDQLWALGTKSTPPQIDDIEMIEALRKKEANEEYEEESENSAENTEDDQANEDLACGVKALVLDHDICREANGTAAGGGAEEGMAEMAVGGSAEELKEEEEEDTDDEEEEELRRERMDELLIVCFMCAIKSRVKKSDLPLLTSNFFRNHLQPCCPPDQTVDVKKSSYKKLTKFLKAMQNRGYVKVKELQKGVESIVEIHKDHMDFRDFKIPDFPPAGQPEPSRTSPTPSCGKVVPPEIIELYTVNAATLPFFKPYGYSKGAALTVQDIRHCLSKYINENELKSSIRKGLIVMDPILSDLLLNKGEYNEDMMWEDIMTRVQSKMNPAYRVAKPGESGTVKKGKLQPIVFSVAQRGGNKKVTLVHNLEPFGIDPTEFGHRVQIAVACSTTVSQLPGNHGAEVLIQGNQITFASNLLLEKYKIPKKYLQGLGNAPKVKGKKKKVPTATLR